jgi:hypothetical protein
VNPLEAKYVGDLAVEGLWRLGNVRDWYLKPKQKSALLTIRDMEDPFFEASRRQGKTTTGLGYIVEESILKPGFVTRWCEPWKNQCREIVMTEMDKLQSRIPKRYRFRWNTTDSFYRCDWNDSRIYLRGVNEDRGESARGTAAHIVVCDELGSWREPTYVINEVLLPQILTTRGKLLKLGTPPKNLAHAYYKLKERAQADGNFVQRTIKDQELVEADQVEKLVRAMGGWDSPAVRRELLCEKVVDPNSAIVPEWDDRMIEALPPDEFFAFYLKYDAVDTGVRDNTVCLLAYYDFMKAKLVVLDEIVLTGPEMTTERLAERMRALEATYWKVKWEEFEKEGRKRWRMIAPAHLRLKRVSDIDLRLINDMTTLHGMFIEKTDKGYLEEMVNQMRIFVGQDRLRVHPRCTNLIDCLRYGLWREDRKDWERPEPGVWEDQVELSEFLGHFDALAALMYLIRNLDTKTNPVPFEYGKPEDDFFYEQNRENRRGKLQKMFNVGPRGRLNPAKRS